VARADEMRISGRNDIGRITSAKHIDINGLDLGSLSPEIVTPDTAMRMDGNNVDPDAEMVALSKNSILYDTMTYAINKELGRIKLVARDGR
jgi:flagellar basal-body rod protein FlgB